MNATTHQSFGSQSLRLFRRAIRDGATLEQAAALGDYSLATAKLIHADDLKTPPPPAAFELLYDPDAPADASSTKEPVMAKNEDETGEYHRPNAELAFKIYDTTLKPKEAHLATIKGDMSEPYQQIKDQAHFPRKVLNFIIGLENEEDAKRDHMLLALSEGLKHRQLFLPRDLVTMASGDAGSDVIPTGDRDDDDLLVDEGEDDDVDGPGELPLAAEGPADTFTEASDEELGRQAGRKPRAARTARPSSVTRINPPGSEARAH
jgi:hypothetical protein